MPNKYQRVIQFRGIKVDSGQYSEIFHTKINLLYFVKEMFNGKEIRHASSTVTMEEIAGLVAEKIDVSALTIPRSFIE